MSGSARLALAAALAAASAAGAGDWPQWRGPHLNGSSDETGLPERFTRTENIAWVARMPGASGATPIVIGKRIFLVSPAKVGDDLLAMCFSTADGNMLWSIPLSRGRAPARGEIAACSPASDGRKVWWLFGTGDLAATDLDGRVLWRKSLVREYGSFAIKFGYGASPLLHNGRLYISLLRRDRPYAYSPGAAASADGGLKSYVLCFDAATGRELWRCVRATDAKEESREAYITPMLAPAAGRLEVIIPGGEFVTGHDSQTGRELWRWPITSRREIWQRIVVSPVVGEGLVYVCQAQQQAMFALRPGARGRVPHEQYVWKLPGPTPDVCTPLLYRGRLYALAGDAKILYCLEPKTGKVIWSRNIGGAGPYRASPTGADGKIYCISEGGDFVVLAAGDEFRELYRISLKARPCRSSIVAADGALFLRLAKHLVCVRKGAGG